MQDGTAMPVNDRKQEKRPPRTFLVMSMFLLMVILGVGFEEPGRVLAQAVQVCFSCIGIG